MKFILALILSFSAFTAIAGEVIVVDKPVADVKLPRIDRIDTDFEINAELERAWVEITYIVTGHQENIKDFERIKIEGLSYNASTKEIILDADGVQKVCAKVKTNFFGTFVNETGECKFTKKFYIVQEDNGFEIKKVNKLKITLKF